MRQSQNFRGAEDTVCAYTLYNS